MKFPRGKNGQLGLMLSLSVLVSSCNPEDYFPIEQMVAGADAYCAKALDENSCQAMSDMCQPAYMEQSEEMEAISEAPVFSACIANPDAWAPEDGSTTGGTAGGSTGGTDGGTAGGTSGGSDGGTTGGNNGGGNGGGNGGTSGGIGDGSDDGLPPTIEDTIAAKCENLDPQYVLTSHETKKGKVIKTVKKVKVCHMTGNGSSHSIIIACQALKPHKQHHDDYIGACEL